jgi:hypothetical protein
MEEGGGHSSEDVVGKYKRLLSMARSSLETNQKSLAEKDSIIEGLQAMVERLERDKSLAMNGRDNYKLHDEVSMPRNLSRRVDVNGIIWILVEYDHHHSDSWRSFSTEQDLDDFIRRLPGGTLTKPQRCYSVTESAQIESEAKTKIDKVVDEFRRYKVKMEIARKQSSVDTKHRQAVIEDSGIVVDEEHNSVDQYLKYKEENSRLQSQLSSIEAKWKLAYEKLVRENESLRLSGGEALLAAQWRERYETTSKEKYDLQEKLKVFERGKSSEVGGKSIEEAYNELKDDHRVQACCVYYSICNLFEYNCCCYRSCNDV